MAATAHISCCDGQQACAGYMQMIITCGWVHAEAKVGARSPQRMARCTHIVLLAVACFMLPWATANAKLPAHVCKESGSSYCSCQAWPSSHAPYVGFVDEARELNQALEAASYRNE